MDKLWSKSESAHLQRYANSQTLEELAQRFHTDTEAVREKIEELGLSPKPGNIYDQDEAFGHFEKAVGFFHEKKYEAAVEHLEKAIAETDTRQLADRARQYLQICRDRLEKEPEVEDLYLAAVMEKNRGRLDSALELCEKHGGDPEKDEKLAYLLASIRALSGDEDEAIEHLARAIELEPRNRVHAYHDADFASLREHEALARLLGATPPAPTSSAASETELAETAAEA